MHHATCIPACILGPHASGILLVGAQGITVVDTSIVEDDIKFVELSELNVVKLEHERRLKEDGTLHFLDIARIYH